MRKRTQKWLRHCPQPVIINIKQTEYRSTPDGGSAGRKPYKGVGRFYSEMGESFRAFSVLPENSLPGRKTGRTHMNTENMNQNADPAVGQGTGERTFSQEDVNRIVQERLAKDREKASKELGEREQELARREFRLNSRQKLIDRGYPESIMDALNCSDEKSFDRALDIIDGLIKERMPSEQETAEMEAMRKAAASAPKFTDRSEGRPSGIDMIRRAMNL